VPLVEPIANTVLPYDLVPNPFYFFEKPIADIKPKHFPKIPKPVKPKKPEINDDWAQSKLFKQIEAQFN
jgi:hypothetical protein